MFVWLIEPVRAIDSSISQIIDTFVFYVSTIYLEGLIVMSTDKPIELPGCPLNRVQSLHTIWARFDMIQIKEANGLARFQTSENVPLNYYFAWVERFSSFEKQSNQIFTSNFVALLLKRELVISRQTGPNSSRMWILLHNCQLDWWMVVNASIRVWTV